MITNKLQGDTVISLYYRKLEVSIRKIEIVNVNSNIAVLHKSFPACSFSRGFFVNL